MKILRSTAAASLALILLGGAASAQDAADRAPPKNGQKLSEIVAKVEQREGFRYIDEIDWDDGAYEVTYFTADKAKVEIRYDPVTGAPK